VTACGGSTVDVAGGTSVRLCRGPLGYQRGSLDREAVRSYIKSITNQLEFNMNRVVLSALVSSVTTRTPASEAGPSLWLVSLSRAGRDALPSPYDTYDSMVVVASSEAEARTYHPNGEDRWTFGSWVGVASHREEQWVAEAWVTDPMSDHLLVRHLGGAATGVTGVVCSSFNAG